MSAIRTEATVTTRSTIASRPTPGWIRNPDSPFWKTVRAVGMLALFFTFWGLAVRFSHSDLFPTPGNVLRGIIELAQKASGLTAYATRTLAYRPGEETLLAAARAERTARRSECPAAGRTPVSRASYFLPLKISGTKSARLVRHTGQV